MCVQRAVGFRVWRPLSRDPSPQFSSAALSWLTSLQDHHQIHAALGQETQQRAPGAGLGGAVRVVPVGEWRHLPSGSEPDGQVGPGLTGVQGLRRGLALGMARLGVSC